MHRFKTCTIDIQDAICCVKIETMTSDYSVNHLESSADLAACQLQLKHSCNLGTYMDASPCHLSDIHHYACMIHQFRLSLTPRSLLS